MLDIYTYLRLLESTALNRSGRSVLEELALRDEAGLLHLLLLLLDIVIPEAIIIVVVVYGHQVPVNLLISERSLICFGILFQWEISEASLDLWLHCV